MSKKVKFCTIGLYDAENNLLSMDFGDFFNDLESRMLSTSAESIIKKVEDHTLRIMKFHRKNGYSDAEFLIPIGKVKPGVTYKIAEDKYNLEEIDYDVFNINLIYYNKCEKVIMITVDKEGPSISLIAKYFQQFLKDGVQVKIEPIYKVAGLEKIESADFVSSVSIALNLTAQEQQLYNNATEEIGNFTQCTQRIANCTRDDFGSNFMVLSFGLGKRSNTSMAKDVVLDLIYKLKLDSEMIREITVRCKGKSDERIDTAKIKESQFSLSLGISSDGMDYILQNADEWFDMLRINYATRVNELKSKSMGESVLDYFKESNPTFA